MGGVADVLGFSCRLPESGSPSEFWKNLMDGVDMVTADDRRWPVGFQGLPPRTGKVPDWEKFDAAFFSVHGKQAQRTDPQLRKVLEVAYEAWMDTGIDFMTLRGSEKVGVYVGACGSDVHAQWLTADLAAITGYEQTGCAHSMFANRVSWWFDFKGPSKCIDTACSSSLVAFNDAISDMLAGRIDYAVVGGACSILRPQTSLAFQRLQMLSPDGHCKSFDASANGYTRSDGIAVVVISRPGLQHAAWHVRAPYARVLASATNNDGHTTEGVTFPSGSAQRDLAEKVCTQAGVNPADVTYVEAHGTGTVAGDGQELSALSAWYGQRPVDNPLLIGSLKSNMGHCEGCSGLAGLIKVCMSFEHGVVPANLHYKEPNPNSEGLINGTLKVVTEPTQLDKGIAALSNFGFGGTNVHVLLENLGEARASSMAAPLHKPDQETPVTSYIIPLAIRSKAGLAPLVEAIRASPGGPTALSGPMRALANSVGGDVSKLNTRAVLADGKLRSAEAPSVAPPVWFVFTGNGSQWPGAGKELFLASPTFQASIMESGRIMQAHGVDLTQCFRPNGQPSGKGDSVDLAAVGLTAIQIALVDTLREEYGIVPSGILGHSAGEIACGYADGGFTQEQTLLVAYHRGRMLRDHGITGGLMAAVGLGVADAEKRLERAGAANCVVACDNSPISTTLSGPADELKPILKELADEGVFMRELDTGGQAFHSPMLAPTVDDLRAHLEAVVPEPKPRSATWLTSTFPTGSEDPEAALCSGGYQVHGYANRALFRQACSNIPKDVIVLEIGPHALLRAALRQNRPDLQYLYTMKRGESSVETLQDAIADLWLKGATVRWPSAETAPAAPLPRPVREALVAWEHSVDYPLPTFKEFTSSGSGAGFQKTYELAKEHSFLCDHVVDGRILMPAASYLVTAWEALANKMDTTTEKLPVEFDDVSIIQAVPALADDSVQLTVLLDSTNHFQVLNKGDLIAEGRIKAVQALKGEADKGGNKENQGDSANVPEATTEAKTRPEAEAKAAEKPAVEIEKPEEVAAAAEPEAEAEADSAVLVDWPFEVLETLSGDSFYLDVARAGIEYAPKFRMLQKRHINGRAAVLRWDGCFIRLLDGMLQAGALIATATSDFELRIPTKIRHLAVKVPSPELPIGSEVLVRVDPDIETAECDICSVTGVELSAAPRRPATHKTIVRKFEWVPYGETIDSDLDRQMYYRLLKGYNRDRIDAAIDAAYPNPEDLPPHLVKCKEFLQDTTNMIVPNEEQLEYLMSGPDHHMARLCRDIFSEENRLKTMQNPIEAIMQHEEHHLLYAKDPLARGFHNNHLSHFINIVAENQIQAGFQVAEIGAGTGGLTRQVIDELERNHYSPMLKYTATDITAGFGPNLLQTVRNPKVDFKVWDVNKPAPKEIGGPFDLILASNAIHACDNMQDTLDNTSAALAEGGFLLLYDFTCSVPALIWGLDARTWTFTDEREYGLWMAKPRWHKILAQAGLELVCEHWCPMETSCLFLYRKIANKNFKPSLLAAPKMRGTDEEVEVFLDEYKRIAETLEVGDGAAPADAAASEADSQDESTEAPAKPRMWLCGDLQDRPGVIGLGRCIRLEARGEYVRWAFDMTHPSSALTAAPAAMSAAPVLDAQKMLEIAAPLDLISNVFNNGRHGTFYAPKTGVDDILECAASEHEPVHGVHLDIGSFGDINSFFWSHNLPFHPEHIKCSVAYGSLNFRDVMLAYGKLSKDLMSHGSGSSGTQIGLEFSGVVEGSGKRVMGMTPQPSIATKVATPPQSLWEVPDWWTLSQAATVPVAYATAYDALVVRGHLKSKHRVLIHSATGAVGLAATRIALNRGCEVFVTCGTAAKRAFLLEAFPALRDDHISDSRSTQFEVMIKKMTKGAGVHLALNSLADDKLQATIRCLGSNGSLLEIGKYDILKGTPLSMRPLLRNIAFIGIDLDRIFNDPANMEETLEVHELLAEGIRSGEVVPLPVNLFERENVSDAFRFMAAGTHMGKVMIEMAADLDKAAPNQAAPYKWPALQPRKQAEEEHASADKAAIAPQQAPALPVFSCRKDRSYVVTGGLGGFGLALAVWLAKHGARNIVLTSKRGMRTGYQNRIITGLREIGVKVEVTTLDVADLDETRQIMCLADSLAPVGGVFHLAMILQDRWLANQDGHNWNETVKPKAHGCLNLDEATQGITTLEHFVLFSSVVASVGNQGQSAYGYATTVAEMVIMSRRAAGLPSLAIQWGVVGNVGYVAETLKGKLIGNVFEWLAQQPVEDCLKVLGACMLAGNKMPAIVGSSAQQIGDKWDSAKDDTNLVDAVLALMGLTADSVNEQDTLAALGIDSMQLMEVRNLLQKRLARIIPVETIPTLTFAMLRQMADEEAGGATAATPAAEESAPAPEQRTDEPVPADTTSDGNASSDEGERSEQVTEVKQQLEKIYPLPEDQKKAAAAAAAKKEGYEGATSPKPNLASAAWEPQTPEIASRAASASNITAEVERSRTPSPPPYKA